MKKIQVAIYFNNEKGYIFFPFGLLKDGPRIIINPAIKENKDISTLEIGNKIMQCMEVSKNALPLEKSEFNKNLVLEISGLKSQTKFNNLYKYLLCEEKDNKLLLVDKKDNKEYVFENEDIAGLGNQVFKILTQNMSYDDSDSLALMTVNENNVIYTRPSDDFDDAGDGHTDAYQIYTYDSNVKNYIAFLIDNGYSDYTENAIRQRWQQMYGTLLEFEFESISNVPLKIQVRGKTKSEMIVSRIYQDGEGMLEVLYEIDLMDTSEKEKVVIKKEFEKVISSIKIQQYLE